MARRVLSEHDFAPLPLCIRKSLMLRMSPRADDAIPSPDQSICWQMTGTVRESFNILARAPHHCANNGMEANEGSVSSRNTVLPEALDCG